MRELPTIEAAAKASPDKIHKLWEGLGYYTRARNLQKAAKQIVAQQNTDSKSSRRQGNESQTKTKSETPSASARLRRDKHVVSYKFPENFDDVLALPGIGRYTAGAICSIAFNQPTPILDGNVIRVLTRIFGIAENPKEKKTNARLWQMAEELVCRAKDAQNDGTECFALFAVFARNEFLFLFEPIPDGTRRAGLHAAKSAMPDLPGQKTLCRVPGKSRRANCPTSANAKPPRPARFVAFVAERNGMFLVRQRPAGVVNAHLWEFPNVEIDPIRSSSPAKRDKSAHYSGKNSQSRLTSAAAVQKLEPEIALAAEQLGFGAYADRVTLHHKTFHHALPHHAGSISPGARRGELYKFPFKAGKFRDSCHSSLRNRSLENAGADAATGLCRRP